MDSNEPIIDQARKIAREDSHPLGNNAAHYERLHRKQDRLDNIQFLVAVILILLAIIWVLLKIFQT